VLSDNWRKSQRSLTAGNCLEARLAPEPTVMEVRDSKDATGPALRFTRVAWASFIAAMDRFETSDTLHS
jgi:hypothetical protein